jgi:hypothetical protein
MRKRRKKNTQKPNKNHYTMRIKKLHKMKEKTTTHTNIQQQNTNKNQTHKYTTTQTTPKPQHIQIYDNHFTTKSHSNIPPPPPLSNKPPQLKPSENLTLDQRINIPHESSYPSQVKICT